MVQGWSVISSKTAYKKAWITSSNKAAVDATFEIKGKASFYLSVFSKTKIIELLRNLKDNQKTLLEKN